MKLKHIGAAASMSLTLLVGAVISPTTFAYDETSVASINVEANHTIAKGYDVVSYFAGKAMKGDQKFSAEYMGATYHFSNEANKNTFLANPGHFAPQFGGFCAMGTALGKKLDVDPTQFVVQNDKLFLNLNADVSKMFKQDLDGNIKKAYNNWPGIKDKAPNTL